MIRHPSIQSLLDEIDAFCARAEMSPSAFGRLCCSDPNFVGDIRDRGRSPSLKLIDRARGFMAAHPAAAPRRPAKAAAVQTCPQKSSRRRS